MFMKAFILLLHILFELGEHYGYILKIIDEQVDNSDQKVD